ncbi:MBL fold metallo-hydrolase [Streptomyces shenzhenensis]|uniref:MBL fold metallo-hydrolase n=1 Tax=Streptomyces shenzhenensis TaxID=943815 RepID=UPI003F541F63
MPAHRAGDPGHGPGPGAALRGLGAAAARQASALLPQDEPVRPGRVTGPSDGDTLDFTGGAHVVHAPGHTHGSIAVHLPEHGVLFTGDAVAAAPGTGEVIPGVFDPDRAGLDAEVACFGHGDHRSMSSSARLAAHATALELLSDSELGIGARRVSRAGADAGA